ncbi:MAG: regulatory protein RecX [Gemmatimonadaceae bacterium]
MSSSLHTITDIREKSTGSGLYLIFVDGAALGVVAAAAISSLGLRQGVTLDVRAMDRLRDAVAEQGVFEKALQLLAARRRSTQELQRRLIRSGAGKSHVEDAVRRLTTLGYLNDTAFADALVRTKMIDGGASRRRVQQELFKKGVARDIADAALAQVAEQYGADEAAAALALARKRLRSLRNLDGPTRRRRLYGFLARRGYDPGAVAAVMKELGEELATDEIGGDSMDEQGSSDEE